MQERQEAEVGKLELPAIGNSDFRRAFHGHVAVVGREGVHGQALDFAPAFHASGTGKPAVLGVGVGNAGRISPGGIHPQILVMVLAVDEFLEVEGIDALEIGAVGKTAQDVR